MNKFKLYVAVCTLAAINTGAIAANPASAGNGDVAAMISGVEDNITVRGKVTAQDGTPLPGVSVKLKGTTVSTLTDTDGAFIGASFGKKFGDLELVAMADFGLAINDVGSAMYGDDFNNFYAGIMANAAYTYGFDGGVFLRPAFRAGYTWVNSASYISRAGNNIGNKDFGFFELTPMLDIYHNVGDGLSIGGHFGYVMNFVTGGKQRVNYETVPELKIKDYFEYGINLSQNFEGFSLNINFGRHDGARNGWNGGAEFKYVF